MRTARWITVLAVALSLLAAGGAEAKKKRNRAPTEPGKYVDWNDEIDELEVVETFALADYTKLLVADFATDGVELPEKDDNTYVPVQTVLSNVEQPLANGIHDELPGIAVERGTSGGAGTLLLRGSVIEMDPGSQAARYWAGFGAGAARTKLQGEVVDAASGRVLLRFTQERRSGVGLGGGGYVELMQRNLHSIGEDLGICLTQF